MLVFNEGVPRAGKSYDAVKNHILPALKKGRRVYARLNGLVAKKIATHLGMSESDVRALLVLVDTKDVTDTFSCIQDETGKWCIPDAFKDALVVIDEVHEFYVNERTPLPPKVENFWALLGQNGGDAVIMTQWINRLHAAIKARIERKNTFQKLTAVGLKSRYRVTYFHTTSPGKFEKVGGQTLRYDAAIFPLYDGYAPGAENTEVYEEGGKTVWAAMAARATIFGVVGAVGIYFFISYFVPDAPAEVDSTADAHASVQTAGQGSGGHFSSVSPVNPPQAPPPDPLEGLNDEQRYVIGLNDRGRIRLSMLVQIGDTSRAWVQWINRDDGQVIEELDTSQLQALGWGVTVERYGVRIATGKHSMVATAWPHTQPIRDSEHRLYNMSPDGAGAGPVSAANGAGAGAGGYGGGGAIISVHSRPMGTFPESVQNRYGGG